MMWQADIITLFPELFPGPLGISLTGRALEKGLWACTAHDLRPYGKGRHHAVDDTPYGGGAGMVMRPDVVASALDALPGNGRPVIYPTPRGRPFSQCDAKRLAAGSGVVILCGRYEGLDERVLEARGIEQFSIGDFVLSGGEIPAFALLEACVRLLPGVMGSSDSATEESFENGLLEYPHYTKPAEWEGLSIPSVLLSGNHRDIAAWRHDQSQRITQSKRPDLWAQYASRKPGI